MSHNMKGSGGGSQERLKLVDTMELGDIDINLSDLTCIILS